MFRRLALICILAVLPLSCGPARKLSRLHKDALAAGLSISEQEELPQIPEEVLRRDTLTVKGEDGRDILIMKAVRDENGEMVATDVLRAAIVTARFRNVAERLGKVDIAFDVTVPPAMQDSRWQLRFYPEMLILGDTLQLEPVVITGENYRKAQLRGYQQYQRFLDSISADSAYFVYRHQLEMFLRRNLPQIYRFRNDSSFVSDEEFASAYGVTEQQAIDHYTNSLAIRWNRRKVDRKSLMFRRFVKAPLDGGGLRLDTVIRTDDQAFLYRYVQTIRTRPALRKVDVELSGSIMEEDRQVYAVPRSGPLTFYISSLSTLMEQRERYLTQVISRRVSSYTACYIDFDAGSALVQPTRGKNVEEIARVRQNLVSLMDNEEFEMDSIIVTASCSPEGTFAYNTRLSGARSQSVADYFSAFMRAYRDSVHRNGMRIDLAGETPGEAPQIHFLSRTSPENWLMLTALVEKDERLTSAEKDRFSGIMAESDPDRREALLSRESFYPYLRESLYPRLRTVRFDFHLHRKWLQQDTLVTTVPDTLYRKGLDALRDHDYERALTILRPYRDLNTALAYCAMDYNASALDILEKLPDSPKRHYLLALLYSRTGKADDAARHYLDACRADRQYISRGNLDPEVSALVRAYGLDKYYNEE